MTLEIEWRPAVALLKPIDYRMSAGSIAPVDSSGSHAFASVIGTLQKGADTAPQTPPARDNVGGLTSSSNVLVANSRFFRPELPEFTGVVPTYTTELPDTPETQRRYFSENTVPMNTVVVTHEPGKDAEAGRRIVQAVYKANPDAKIALLVHEYDASDPSQLKELAAYHDVPASALAPIHFDGWRARANHAIGLFPQDGFMAGAGGLYQPEVGLRHAGNIAKVLSNALGLEVKSRDYIGMGGDTHFLTRPDGEQVAYFGPETILKSMWHFGTAPKNQHRPNPGPDMLFAIGHIMENMVEAGVKLENIAPLGMSGKSGATYGSVLDSMSSEELKQIRPDVLARLQEMRDLPLPIIGASTDPDLFGYHTDLVIASPDGIHAYVNRDDLEANPEWREKLEFFGYKPVPLPASLEIENLYTNRISYLNWVMGEVNGERVILLPTEADDPEQLTDKDRIAIAAIQEHNPEIRIVPIGGEAARMYNVDRKTNEERYHGPHCRTNVIPWIVTPVPIETDSAKMNPQRDKAGAAL